ncbi:MAG: hypothetical protein SNH13_00015 [Rikenellaceae bacterium]
MLKQIITQYLHTSRRLVIPGLGAFIVKGEGGVILFSELLKSDDGILRGLLIANGLRDIEAAALIDRFIFELKHSLGERDGVYIIEGLGLFERSEEGKLRFIHNEEVGVEVSQVEESESEVENSEDEDEAEASEVEAVDKIEEAETKAEKPGEPEDAVEEGLPNQEPISAESYRAQRIKELYASSSKPTFLSEVDPTLKGLEYGKGKAAKRGVKYVPKREKRVDFVMLAAIIAAVVAICVVGYGYNVSFMAEHGISVIDYLMELIFGTQV